MLIPSRRGMESIEDRRKRLKAMASAAAAEQEETGTPSAALETPLLDSPPHPEHRAQTFSYYR